MLLLSRIIKGATLGSTPHVINRRQESMELPNPNEEAASLLAASQQQAATIISDAQQQAESLLQEAQVEGEILKEEAQHQGYDQGIQSAATEASKIRHQAQQVLQQAEQTRQQTLDDMEEEIIVLAVEIAEKLLVTQLRLDADIVAEVAKEALKLVRDRERVTLYVPPQEVDIYLDHKPQLAQALSDRAKLSIIIDEQIAPGGCMIQTEQGMVDATIDTRWQQVLAAVLPKG